MPHLPADLLAQPVGTSPTETLRQDLEDCLKEYSDLDLLVELLQNGLDSLDLKRYLLICGHAQRDPDAVDTVNRWNRAVLRCLDADYAAYQIADTPVAKAALYTEWLSDERRRDKWWSILAEEFGCDKAALIRFVTTMDYRPSLTVIVRHGGEYWIEVVDNGVGIAAIPTIFRHQSSTKRPGQTRPRRLGIRGSHGWGLTAVLGMSEVVEVISRVPGQDAEAYQFSGYASFARSEVAEPQNEQLDLTQGAAAGLFDARIVSGEIEAGTHVRVKISQVKDDSVLGHTLRNFRIERFVNLLRLYTPVGQVNDYVLNPAYHCVRKGDLTVSLVVKSAAGDQTESVPFEILRLSEQEEAACLGYNQFVNAGMPENVSVHTVHRSKKQDNVYLSAAEIQDSDLVHEIEERLEQAGLLPAFQDPMDKVVAAIPRGFQLALSGGMRSEFVAREPKGNMAMFRGFLLAETARPTLGRKHVMDQRTTIPKAASEHQSAYEVERKKVVRKGTSTTITPAHARWKRIYFQESIRKLRDESPLSAALAIWAGRDSREARVMLLFADLLARGVFGDFRVLRAHLKERYDFMFLYSTQVNQTGTRPSLVLAQQLNRGGYGVYDRNDRRYYCYGVGEFKDKGDSIFNDFDPDNPTKSPEAIDLLVCWEFDADQVGEQGWTVEAATDLNADYPGQTHIWKATQSSTLPRTRGLPVVALKDLLGQLVPGTLAAAPAGWPAQLPEVYL